MIARAINRLTTRTDSVGRFDPLNNFWYIPTPSITSDGTLVGDTAALNVGTAYRCIQVLADTVGAMPWHIYEETDSATKSKAPDHELYTTVHSSPNVWQSPIDFKSMAMVHLQLRGNFYARLDPPGAWRDDKQLVPLHPDRMTVEQLNSGRLWYTHTDKLGEQRSYAQDRIYHVRLMSNDGVMGMTGAKYARHVLGLSLAQLSYAKSMYANGGFFKYYLKSKKAMNKQAVENFRAGWKDVHGGGKFQPPILEEDMELVPLGMTPEDAQFFEARRGNGLEVCQFFGVPPHLAFLGDDSKANMEQKGLDFLRFSLDPLLVRFEQALQPMVGDGYYSKFKRDAIVRPSLKERYEAHQTAVGGPWKTADEAREDEDMEPLGGNASELRPAPNASLKQPSSAKFNQPVEEPDTSGDTDTQSINLTPLVQDVAERIVTREVKGLANTDSVCKTAKERNAKIARWYQGHADYIVAAVTPLAQASAVATWDVSGWADEYCLSSIAALDHHPVADTLTEWEQTKAAAVAADITEALRCTTE